MKIRTIEFQKPITIENLRSSVKYHCKKLRELYAKNNKYCFIAIHTKIFGGNYEPYNSMDKYVLNILDNREINAYCQLVTIYCMNNPSKKASLKPKKIQLLYQVTNEQEYKDFLANPLAIKNLENL